MSVFSRINILCALSEPSRVSFFSKIYIVAAAFPIFRGASFSNVIGHLGRTTVIERISLFEPIGRSDVNSKSSYNAKMPC